MFHFHPDGCAHEIAFMLLSAMPAPPFDKYWFSLIDGCFQTIVDQVFEGVMQDRFWSTGGDAGRVSKMRALGSLLGQVIAPAKDQLFLAIGTGVIAFTYPVFCIDQLAFVIPCNPIENFHDSGGCWLSGNGKAHAKRFLVLLSRTSIDELCIEAKEISSRILSAASTSEYSSHLALRPNKQLSSKHTVHCSVSINHGNEYLLRGL
jgi:hypothetical protein